MQPTTVINAKRNVDIAIECLNALWVAIDLDANNNDRENLLSQIDEALSLVKRVGQAL